MRKYALSPSTLNIFIDCPRCFWLHINRNIKRPRGIFPSLPGGMDLVIKSYYDRFRLRNELPPELIGRVEGTLFQDIKTLNKWRSWKDTNLIYEDVSLNTTLSGALDDCLVDNNYYIPLDYKTRGSAVQEDSSKYYQLQLDSYCLMLESIGCKTKNLAYLVYYWPNEVKERGNVNFNIQTVKLTTNINSAKKVLRDAVLLLNGDIPKASANCEYCKLVMIRKNESSY